MDVWTQGDRNTTPILMWKLFPVEREIPPPYDGGAVGQDSTCVHCVESEYDDFGKIVTEVTVTTRTRRVPRDKV